LLGALYAKRKEESMASVDVDIKKLLEAGAHFGHKTSRWHPKMAPYIHSKRAGSHIIDLTKTVEALEVSLDFLARTAGQGKQVLLVGTKRQAKDIIKKAAEETGMPFVAERWVGGMLTNTATMNGRIKHLKDLEVKMDSGALEAKYNKLEVQRFQEEIDHLNFLYGGIKYMQGKPGVLFVVDIKDDINAVREARKLGIPVVAIADSNSDPSIVDYPIPANDDAIKGLELITAYAVQAIEHGKANHAKKADQEEKVKKAEAAKAEPKEEKTESEGERPVMVSA
jgi:small subunit ribosomal protein S2